MKRKCTLVAGLLLGILAPCACGKDDGEAVVAKKAGKGLLALTVGQ